VAQLHQKEMAERETKLLNSWKISKNFKVATKWNKSRDVKW